ncbi:MAG: hypothetical protein J2P46_12000 [Zavarzinella sp.]|nr:hypothetical protein [Zavarzinella sp.]
MRWLFPDPDDRTEAADRKRTLGRIKDWWAAFADKAPALGDLFRGKRQWDLPKWMHQNLGAVDPNLMWEFGPAVRTEGHRLVITPESRQHLRPLVRTILDRAPDLAGWEFYPHRLAEDLDQANQAVAGRTGGTLDGVTVELQIGEGNRIDLLFRSPATKREGDQAAMNVAFVATEALLGERALDRWVGAIEVARPVRGEKSRALPLERLKDTFDALVDSIRDRLPDKPYAEWALKAGWSVIKLQPEQADDYPGRADLFVATTCDVEMWKATHRPAQFYSQRFSRHKETFAYVKIDGRQFRRGSEAADRGEIEHALDEALAKDGLGVHIGGGTGLMYSYIDLALTDLDRGVERVRDTLRKVRVPERSWVLFFDADLAAEWVGVYPQTPAPPAEPEDE